MNVIEEYRSGMESLSYIQGKLGECAVMLNGYLLNFEHQNRFRPMYDKLDKARACALEAHEAVKVITEWLNEG